jgi:hypothetical protein
MASGHVPRAIALRAQNLTGLCRGFAANSDRGNGGMNATKAYLTLGAWPEPLREPVEDVACPVNPAALNARRGKDFGQGLSESQGAVTVSQLGIHR